MIGSDLYSILTGTGSATLAGYVGTRIFPVVAPQSTVTPYLIYKIDSDNPTNTKSGKSKVDYYDVTLVCIADTYLQCENVATAVRNLLDRYSSSLLAINQIIFDSMMFEFNIELKKFVGELDFTIRKKY